MYMFTYCLFLFIHFSQTSGIVNRQQGNRSQILPNAPETQFASSCITRIMSKQFVPRPDLLTFLTFDDNLDVAFYVQDEVMRQANWASLWSVDIINSLYRVQQYDNSTMELEYEEGNEEAHMRKMMHRTKFCVAIVDAFDVFVYNLDRFVVLDNYDSSVSFLVRKFLL